MKRITPAPSYTFTPADLKVLLERAEGFCVSIYFPAHRRKVQTGPDSILYRNLCRNVEKVLRNDTSAATTEAIVSRLRAVDEPEFWERGSEGVAVFASQDFLACYRLPMEVPTLEVVGGSFHTKPMLRYLQEAFSFHVLVLSLGQVTLYDGWREGLQEVPLHDVPRSLAEALGRETLPGYRASHQRSESRIHHAQGAGGDDSNADVEKYFRKVARGLRADGLKDAQKPLILAAHRHHGPLFRKVAQIPTLLDEGIVADAGKLTTDVMCSEARRILQPEFDRRIAQAREDYGLAASRGRGSESPQKVAKAVAERRVQRLFVESGRRFWGLLDKATGTVVPGEVHKNAYDVDILDELAELTLAHGGEVFVLPPEEMPTSTGVAATYRY